MFSDAVALFIGTTNVVAVRTKGSEIIEEIESPLPEGTFDGNQLLEPAHIKEAVAAILEETPFTKAHVVLGSQLTYFTECLIVSQKKAALRSVISAALPEPLDTLNFSTERIANTKEGARHVVQAMNNKCIQDIDTALKEEKINVLSYVGETQLVAGKLGKEFKKNPYVFVYKGEENTTVSLCVGAHILDEEVCMQDSSSALQHAVAQMCTQGNATKVVILADDKTSKAIASGLSQQEGVEVETREWHEAIAMTYAGHSSARLQLEIGKSHRIRNLGIVSVVLIVAAAAVTFAALKVNGYSIKINTEPILEYIDQLDMESWFNR